eukprot:8611908-Alexandrium_andersonii.AAC.1
MAVPARLRDELRPRALPARRRRVEPLQRVAARRVRPAVQPLRRDGLAVGDALVLQVPATSRVAVPEPVEARPAGVIQHLSNAHG